MSVSFNILVISDSHRQTEPLNRLLEVFAPQVQMVVHLGDCAPDLLQFQKKYPHLEMYAVAGNSDFNPSDKILMPDERIIEIPVSLSRRILMLHGHRQNVKSGYDRLMYYAEEKKADACLFGHTHQPAAFMKGPVFFFNPGSLGLPRDGRKAYGLLSVSDKAITGKGLFLP